MKRCTLLILAIVLTLPGCASKQENPESVSSLPWNRPMHGEEPSPYAAMFGGSGKR